jgi:beta-lactamase regulating signal transducer with metallopeptidase domain
VFALRGIAVSFSVFVLVYCALSLAVCLAWRAFWLHTQRNPQRYSARRVADLLFALRVFPLTSAAVITAVFTVPSFLLLEPRAIQEPVGEVPLGLGLCGAALGIFGVVNAVVAMRRASRAIAAWTRGSQPIPASAPVPVLRISRSVPAMIAAGIAHPRVLVSGLAESSLSANELQSALSHEVAHLRRRDNMKKLLLRFVVFPGMTALEAAWLEATEMAADDAAVTNAGEALDLAAALIKLSQLGPVESPIDLTAALVQSPASIMNARVERLIAWSDEQNVPQQRRSPWLGVGAALVTIAAFAVTYSQLLIHIHTATEWLVR